MKALSDIQAEAYRLNKHLDEVKASISTQLHELYDSSEDIKNLLTKLENMNGGEYSIDGHNMLIYSVPVPKDIAELPEIRDYLTQDCYFIAAHRKEYLLAQTCGEFISVSHYHNRDSYYVYDHETSTPIIANREDWMTMEYVQAMIEKHQRKTGTFGDIIKTDYYGGYYSHLDALGDDLTDVELDDLIGSLTPKEDEE